MKLAIASCCAPVDMQLSYPTVWAASRHRTAKNLRNSYSLPATSAAEVRVPNTFEGALKQDYTG